MKSLLAGVLVLVASGIGFAADTAPRTLTAQVVYSDKNVRTFVVPNSVAGEDVSLPIDMDGKRYILTANAYEELGKTLAHISLQDSSIIVPGVAGPASTISSRALVVFEATYPYTLGDRIKVLSTPEYEFYVQVSKKDE